MLDQFIHDVSHRVKKMSMLHQYCYTMARTLTHTHTYIPLYSIEECNLKPSTRICSRAKLTSCIRGEKHPQRRLTMLLAKLVGF